MYKLVFSILLISLGISFAHGQDKGLSRADRKMLDSMLKNDEFLKLLKDYNRSYFDVNVGMGNGVFSQKNNTINTSQSETRQIFFTPSVGYYHKSGAAITFSGNLVNDNGKMRMYQYAINPSYTYDNKNVTAQVSYTWYIKGSHVTLEPSPFQNDFFISGLYKRTWIEPGLSAGLTTGKITEYFDSSFWFTPPPPLQPRIIHITDTIVTKVRGFSLSASASHQWDFEKLLTKKDALSLHPTLFLNAGSQRWTVNHSSTLNKRRPAVQNALKNRYGDGTSTESFNLQSIAFAGELTYFFGKFYLQSQVYLDYYLPSTTSNRLTTLYAVLLGISF